MVGGIVIVIVIVRARLEVIVFSRTAVSGMFVAVIVDVDGDWELSAAVQDYAPFCRIPCHLSLRWRS